MPVVLAASVYSGRKGFVGHCTVTAFDRVEFCLGGLLRGDLSWTHPIITRNFKREFCLGNNIWKSSDQAENVQQKNVWTHFYLISR